MKWPTLLTATAVALSVSGCDKIPFLGRKAPPPDTLAAPAETAQVAPTEPVAAPAEPVQASAPPPRPLVDEPWTPVDTGTVVPGMTREQVIATWGIPVAERVSGNRGYLYFRNGCEVTCGTFDVVFLEDGQVVDAIVRGPGHTYAGTSSSPPGRAPAASVAQATAAPSEEAPAEMAGAPEADALVAAMDSRYRESIATPEGQAYEPMAVAAFWGDSAFVQHCAPPGDPDDPPIPPLTAYFEVLQAGQLGMVVIHPENDVARCIQNQVAGRVFPTPPAIFVGKVNLTFTR